MLLTSYFACLGDQTVLGGPDDDVLPTAVRIQRYGMYLLLADTVGLHASRPEYA